MKKVLNVHINGTLNVLEYDTTKNGNIRKVSSELASSLKAKDVCVIGCDKATHSFVATNDQQTNRNLFNNTCILYECKLQGIDLNDSKTFSKVMKTSELIESVYFGRGKNFTNISGNTFLEKKTGGLKVYNTLESEGVKAVQTSNKLFWYEERKAIGGLQTIRKESEYALAAKMISDGIASNSQIKLVERINKQKQLAASNK